MRRLILSAGVSLCLLQCGGEFTSGNSSGGAAGTNGASGSSSGGSAGTNGSAGTSGSAGTNGSAGTSGSAGTNGSAGTGGKGGNGGTVGSSGGSGGTGQGGTSGSGGQEFFKCAMNSDCIVVSKSCCGSCGAATRDDSVGVNKALGAAYKMSVCGANTGCPTCYMAQDPYLVATCRASRCEVVDLLLEAVTACTSNTQCRLRTNVCCECGGPTDPEHLIAINSAGEQGFQSLVCDANHACGRCAAVYPDLPTACSSGRCKIGGP